MYCCKCGAFQEESSFQKIVFRAECSNCATSLHSCQNCRFYEPGRPNDCKIPGTEKILDRIASNFCEEFSPSIQKKEIKTDQGKKKFEDLFK